MYFYNLLKVKYVLYPYIYSTWLLKLYDITYEQLTIKYK